MKWSGKWRTNALPATVTAAVARAKNAAMWEKLRFLSIVYQLDARAEKHDAELRQRIASTRQHRRSRTETPRGT